MPHRNDISLPDLLSWIAAAPAEELDPILDAIGDRLRTLHPDWEILYFALPKANQEQALLALLEQVRKYW